jgi:hypothetical protein
LPFHTEWEGKYYAIQTEEPGWQAPEGCPAPLYEQQLPIKSEVSNPRFANALVSDFAGSPIGFENRTQLKPFGVVDYAMGNDLLGCTQISVARAMNF